MIWVQSRYPRYMFIQKSALINVATNACFNTARNILRDFNEISFLKSNRSLDDFTQTTRVRAISTIKDELLKSNPGHGILTNNEVIKESETGLTWAINPIDCISNFMHCLPFFGICITLIDQSSINKSSKKDESDNQSRSGITDYGSSNTSNHAIPNAMLDASAKDIIDYNVLAAIFYDPIRDETFWAEKNSGAYLNSKKLTLISNSQMQIKLNQKEVDILKLNAGCSKSANRNFGSSVMHMAYVAAKRIDSAIEQIDDIANICAGKLLVQEAKRTIKYNNGIITASR